MTDYPPATTLRANHPKLWRYPAEGGGWPTITEPTPEDILPFLEDDPPPSIIEIAVALGVHRVRLWEWAKDNPQLRAMLDYAKARHEAGYVKRLSGLVPDPNAMFGLKALHGHSDRPPPVSGGITFKVEPIRGVLTIEQKIEDEDPDAIDADYTVVDP